MYEVITDLVDDLVADLPAEARAQFTKVVEALALTPLAGFFTDPDQPGQFPTLLWPMETNQGYGQVLYTVYHRPNEVVLDPARALESDRVVIDDIVWIG
ncbi:hypothetical protein [Actinomycetospora soli]|uniref:hypothetical protein n=1 Tax=Actinomycetospora soli TaxID=2893887 RepID=UPI001E2D82E9|nr:hypothetical protein [Actinomycetospora soli]MCD2191333.1 hypothetical protein [Actinomycetospora soli]